MIDTRLTRMFGLAWPIVLAPMGGVAGGALAAAVSNAGGLGLVGGGYGDVAWLHRELALARSGTAKPWGAGLITWSADAERVKLVLGYRPAAFMLSFGDPRPYAPMIRDAGCRLICQVQDLASARVAADAGADLIVAQGTEGGGHGGRRGTLPLVPAVIDAVAPIPVIAAGGIADGRGLAAALALGADGGLIGTRFYASDEALGPDEAKRRIATGGGEDTQRTHVFDIVRRYAWPTGHTGRALINPFLERWHGRETALADTAEQEAPSYWAAAAAGDCDTMVVWASEAIDLVDRVEAASALVRRIGSDAEARLRAVCANIRAPAGG